MRKDEEALMDEEGRIYPLLDESSKSASLDGYELAVSIDGKVTLSLAGINICRQWFAAVQDINPGYLNKTDYILAAMLFNACGMRVPHSILYRCS